tara:strand:+ start:342 stop:800 length:459 start_codon:yes stop_codon:yes gene_type:complete
MNYPLTTNQEILLSLSRVIPINELRYKIVAYKNQIEKKEALEYHSERWETISSGYFRATEVQYGFNGLHGELHISSWIADDNNWVATKDHNLDFYNETGFSYQVRNLLMNLLSCPVSLSDNILNCSLYEWRKYDDKLYGFLSRMIKEKLEGN